MPLLKYLADTNTVSDYFRPGNPVKTWFASHRGQIGISTLTLAELRRGIELKGETKARFALERTCDFILEDYREAIYAFDEAAASEWGRLMVETKDHPIPYDDSVPIRFVDKTGFPGGAPTFRRLKPLAGGKAAHAHGQSRSQTGAPTGVLASNRIG